MTVSGEFLALLSAVSWAFGVVVIRKSGHHSATCQNLIRQFTALLIFAGILAICCRRWTPPSLTDFLTLAGSSFTGIVLAQTFFMKAMNLIGAGKTALIDSLYMPVTILLSLLFLNETISTFQIIGGSAMFISVIVITAIGDRTPINLKGILFAVMAVFFSATGTILLKPLVNHLPVLEILFLRLLIAVPILSGVGVVRKGTRNSEIVATIRSRPGAFIIVGTLFSDIMAPFLWLFAIKNSSVVLTTMIGQLTTVFTVLFGVLLLHESVNKRIILGVLISLAGAFFLL